MATINKSETLPLSVREWQRGSGKRGRQDHQHVFYFKRLQTALKIKWGPLVGDSEKQELPSSEESGFFVELIRNLKTFVSRKYLNEIFQWW